MYNELYNLTTFQDLFVVGFYNQRSMKKTNFNQGYIMVLTYLLGYFINLDQAFCIRNIKLYYFEFQVSYVSFLDIWMVMCIIFIFIVLIEFAIVTSLLRRQEKRTAEKIESVGILLIPLMFLLFNVIYWCCLFFT